MENDLAGLHLSFLDIGLVSDEHDWDVGGDSGEIFVPFGHIFVRDSRCEVEHDDGAIGIDAESGLNY